MFGSATMPFVLNQKAVPKQNHQRLMEIRRPNLNLQDKYVMMNGQIIERSKYRAPNPSRADQYAALLEAHKTSRYMRNENPLEDPYVTRRLDQTAKINDYLQKASITKVKADIVKNITEISNKHIELSRNLARNQKGDADNLRREIIALGRETQALARTIAAPDNTGQVDLKRFLMEPDWDETSEGIAELQALLDEARGYLFDAEHEEAPEFDSEQPVEGQASTEDMGVPSIPREESAPLAPEVPGVPEAMPPALEVPTVEVPEAMPSTVEAPTPIVDNGDPSADTNVADALPVLEAELSNLQTIGEFVYMPVAEKLRVFRDAALAADGIVNERELEPEAEANEEPDEAEANKEPEEAEAEAEDEAAAFTKSLKYVPDLGRVQTRSAEMFDTLEALANRVAAMVPTIANGPDGNRLESLQIASRILYYGRPKFYRIAAGNRIQVSDLVDRLNAWGISYIRYPSSANMLGIRRSGFSLDALYPMLKTNVATLTKTEALEKAMYYAIAFKESNLKDGPTSILSSSTQSGREVNIIDALKARSNSTDELISSSFVVDLFNAVLNPKYRGIADLLAMEVNPSLKPVSTPTLTPKDVLAATRRQARLQKRNEEAEPEPMA